MSEKKIAFIFPPFVSEYSDDQLTHLPDLSGLFYALLKEASDHLSTDLINFDVRSGNFLDDELKTQYITYIFSSALSSYLKDSGVKPVLCAGYSMGIYPALFYTESVSFLNGLDLVRRAFESVSLGSHSYEYAMGTVVGLAREDILEILKKNKYQVKITNQNSRYSFVLAGLRDEIVKFLDFAKLEGALNTRMLNVSAPYHTDFTQGSGVDHRKILTGTTLQCPVIPLVSLIDQKILSSGNSVGREIVRNLHSSLNWYETQLFLQRSGISLFIEVGFGNTLTKNAKFIEGEFRFLSTVSPHFLTEISRFI